jgi:CubicO group peptidase (beta-lactamase class C family)
MLKSAWLKILLMSLGVLVAALGAGWFLIGPDWRALVANPPAGRDVLFWSQGQRSATFRMMDQIPFIVSSNPIKAGTSVRALEAGAQLDPGIALDAYMGSQQTAGLVILHKGKVRLERYGLDFKPTGRWTSFSVAKSMTSTLVGAAVRDGHIRGLEDPVTTYLPELKGSAYDGVSVKQILTMTSGVGWKEDYSDPKSDVALYDLHVPEAGMDTTVSYMRTLKRAHPPGTVWNYSTGETNLVGVLVARATDKSPAQYLSERIWAPYGMEQDATWLLGSTGLEMTGCCIQASTRDFARFGQFIMEGGVAGGAAVLPAGWLKDATRKQAPTGTRGLGYGYQWWTWDDGSFQADGIFGQGIFIDPARQLVIASNSNWTSADGDVDGEWEARNDFYRAVQRALDAEAAR